MEKQYIPIDDVKITWFTSDDFDEKQMKTSPRTWHYCSKLGRMVNNNLMDVPCKCPKHNRRQRQSPPAPSPPEITAGAGSSPFTPRRYSPLYRNVATGRDMKQEREGVHQAILKLAEKPRSQSMGHMQMEPFEDMLQERIAAQETSIVTQ